MEAVIVAAITACVPAAVTLITSYQGKRQSRMNSAKMTILQMQMEDIVAVEILKQPPRNYVNIHYEYDIYHKNGGNSDIDAKMKEYDAWYAGVANKAKKKGAKNGKNIK